MKTLFIGRNVDILTKVIPGIVVHRQIKNIQVFTHDIQDYDFLDKLQVPHSFPEHIDELDRDTYTLLVVDSVEYKKCLEEFIFDHEHFFTLIISDIDSTWVKKFALYSFDTLVLTQSEDAPKLRYRFRLPEFDNDTTFLIIFTLQKKIILIDR